MSLSNIVRGRSKSTLNFDDTILNLTREDSYHHHHPQHHSEHHHVEATNEDDTFEPGIYCKTPRITTVKDKSDCLKKVNINQLKEFMRVRTKLHDHTPIWVDVQGMEEDSMKTIAEIFGLHPLTLEECMVSDTLEKIVTRNNYLYMVFNDFSLHPDHSGTTSVNLNIIIFSDLILTIHYKPVHSIYTVVPKLEYCKDTQVPSIEFVLYVVLAHMLDYLEAYINQLDTEAEDLDQLVVSMPRVNYGKNAEVLYRIGATTKLTSSMLEGLVTKSEICSVLLRQSIFTMNGMRYLRSANDHVLKLQMRLALARDILNDTNTLYMSKVSVELSLMSNEVGVLIRRLGVIGTIFLPLNLVAGIFGMNVLVPSHADTHHPRHIPNGFIVLMVFMIAITVFQIGFFHYLKWL